MDEKWIESNFSRSLKYFDLIIILEFPLVLFSPFSLFFVCACDIDSSTFRTLRWDRLLAWTQDEKLQLDTFSSCKRYLWAPGQCHLHKNQWWSCLRSDEANCNASGARRLLPARATRGNSHRKDEAILLQTHNGFNLRRWVVVKLEVFFFSFSLLYEELLNVSMSCLFDCQQYLSSPYTIYNLTWLLTFQLHQASSNWICVSYTRNSDNNFSSPLFLSSTSRAMHIEYTIIVIIVAHHTYDIDDIARQRRRVRRAIANNWQFPIQFISHWQTPQSIFRCRSSSTSSHRSYRRHIPKMSASPCRVTRTRQPETAVQVISWNQPSSFHHRLNQKCLEANGIFCRVRFVERLLIGRVCWSDTWERIQVRYTFPRWGLLRCSNRNVFFFCASFFSLMLHRIALRAISPSTQIRWKATYLRRMRQRIQYLELAQHTSKNSFGWKASR